MPTSLHSVADILNSKNEFSANDIPELEIRYGTNVENVGQKRKRNTEVPSTRPSNPPTEVGQNQETMRPNAQDPATNNPTNASETNKNTSRSLLEPPSGGLGDTDAGGSAILVVG